MNLESFLYGRVRDSLGDMELPSVCGITRRWFILASYYNEQVGISDNVLRQDTLLCSA